MKTIGLFLILAFIGQSYCDLCPLPPSNWSVFCGDNATNPGEYYLFNIVFEMPITYFMDRSIQFCIMNGNGPYRSPLVNVIDSTSRLCLYRYDPVRLRQKSESIQLTFFDQTFQQSGANMATGLQQNITIGGNFPYKLVPNNVEFKNRFNVNYTTTFYFQVTYFGAGTTIGAEIFDASEDIIRLDYSPFNAGDYVYSVLGSIGVIIVCCLFIYGFFIQPYYL